MSRRLSRVSLLAPSALALAAGLALPAGAQSPPPRDANAEALAAAPLLLGPRDDLVITAERRPAPAATVPVSVSAFTARDLEGRAITTLRDVGPVVPNMFVASLPGLGSGNSVYIRGLGTADPFGNADPAVGIFIDNVYIGRQTANNFNLLDAGRLEVISGSEGMLWGRGTSGGVIAVTNSAPGDVFGGFAEFRYASFNTYVMRAALDMPLGSKAGFKLSGFFEDSSGYVRNTTTGEQLNDSDGLGLRGALRVDFSDDVSWNVAVSYVQNDAETLLNFRCDPADPGLCDTRYATTGLTKATSSYAPLVISGSKARQGLGNASQTALLTSNLTWAADWGTAALITGWLQVNQQFGLDFADGRALPDIADPDPVVRGYPLGGRTVLSDGSYSQFSQELRLSGALFGDRLSWLAGALYLGSSDTSDTAELGTAWTGAPQPFLIADRTSVESYSSWAGYVQADYALSRLFSASAGVRYTAETRTLRLFDNRSQCLGAVAGDCLAISGPGGAALPERSDGQWSPRFALTYTPGDALLVYASAARGWRSGGWDTRGTEARAILAYDPESVWTYELGVKSQWFGGRLSADLTGYYLDAAAYQAPAMLERPGAVPLFVTQNIGSFDGYGFEARLAATPWRALSLFANLGLQFGDYSLDGSAPDVNAAGIASVAYQQQLCRAQLAAGQVPLSPNSAPPGSTPNNAPACAAGLVAADGSLAEPVRLPAVNLAAGAAYRFHIPYAGIYLTPSATLFWRSDYQTGFGNATLYSGGITAGAGGGNRSFPANPFTGDYISGSAGAGTAWVNAAVTMHTDDGNWTLSLECQNCFDQGNVESSWAGTTYYNTPQVLMLRLKRTL